MGENCAACGFLVEEGETYGCVGHDEPVCGACSRGCGSCGDGICEYNGGQNGCAAGNCNNCGELVCEKCFFKCPYCGNGSCQKCSHVTSELYRACKRCNA